MGAEILDNLRDRLVNVFEPLVVQSAKSRIGCGEPERSQHYLLVIGFDRPFFEERPRLLDGFDRIARQHALIGCLLRSERRLVSQHDVDELKTVDMPGQNHEAQGQGCGKQEP